MTDATALSEAERLRAIEQVKRDFAMCFSSPVGQRVLIFFADFCRAAESCVAIERKGAPIDINRTLVLEGRREVFLEIQKYLNLTPEHLFLLATGRPYSTGEAINE